MYMYIKYCIIYINKLYYIIYIHMYMCIYIYTYIYIYIQIYIQFQKYFYNLIIVYEIIFRGINHSDELE